MKILVILAYYNRPNMVRNALNSIMRQDFQNWELAFIDDGSDIPGKPVVEEVLGAENMHNVKFYHIPDTVAIKYANGGSRHGLYMNMARKDSDADIVVILCDDDALIEGSLAKLADYYERNPMVPYSYSHVIEFDPTKEVPVNLPHRQSWFNRLNADINCACQVDSSQVTFRNSCEVEYPYPQTGALDAALFTQLSEKYGMAPFNGIFLQYKAVFDDQMGNRKGDKILAPRDQCYVS